MRKVVSVNVGRLGNIFFSVAAGKYYADKHGYDFYLFDNKCDNHFLEKIKDDEPFKNVFKGIKIIDNFNKKEFEHIPEKDPYSPINPNTSLNIFIDGCRQNPKYWDNDKEYILKLFKPGNGIIKAIKETYKINFKKYVCIHVRRGDYANNAIDCILGLLDKKYFFDIINKFPKEQKFLIVSDDIEWCKSIFIGDNFFFADKEVDGYRKMYADFWIQTLCAHNIISNSTFSWWGAYLNRNVSRKVFCPVPFFRVVPREMIPENDNWIAVPTIFAPLHSMKFGAKNNVTSMTITKQKKTENPLRHKIPMMKPRNIQKKLIKLRKR